MLANYVIGRRIRAAKGMTVDLAVTRLYESHPNPRSTTNR